MTSTPLPSNPFPGLRPFRQQEEILFFGREAQVDAMVDKLAATRFLAVVGTSGSGKSSLVNCGLVPALHRGLIAGAGSAWRVATLRPGNRPIRALAEALARPGVLAATETDESGFAPGELMEATLRMSKLGLIDAFEQARLDAGQNLLVVVDQFEELFRYQALATPAAPGRTAHAGEDATAFVNLLLEVAAHRELPIYVVLTMRSDFLGECAQFFGLPEAINRGQYLVPRMTRDERRSAIAGPLGVCGAEIDPVLLTRLVNDVGDNPDQLSILQHALNRTWARWQADGSTGALALPHYEAVGTMAHALNQHAEEAYAALGSERLQQVCAALFKAITDKTSDARGTRRPTRMDTLVEITGATAAELTAVIDVMREPSRSFLMPPAGTPLTPDTPIDLSHESLMRVWERLRAWCDEEAQSAQTYRRLAETAELERAARAGLLRQPDLQFALDWRQRQQPNAAWAQRYRPGFDPTLDFLQRSQQAFDDEARADAARREEQAREEKERRRARQVKLWALPAILFFAIATAVMVYLYREAASEANKANVARQEAVDALAVTKAAQQKESEAVAAAHRAVSAQNLLYAEVARATPELRSKIEQAVESKSLVYLQFADPEQKALAQRLRAQLVKSGYSAPGAEQVGAVPSRSELRYFREADAADAAALAELLKGWNWGALRPRFLKGYEAKQSQLRQIEIWLARPDGAEITRLLQLINADTPEERKAAAQVLQERYPASPQAIAGALALLHADRVGSLSPSGRINALYYLTRTAPLAWTPALEASGREVIERLRKSRDAGRDTEGELLRLERLLDAAKAGEAAPPAANRAAS